MQVRDDEGNRRSVESSSLATVDFQLKNPSILSASMSEKTTASPPGIKEARQYLDLADVLFVALDRQGTVTFANRKACHVLERPEKEIVGRNWFDCFSCKSDEDGEPEYVRRLLEQEMDSGDQLELPVVSGSGEKKTIAWSTRVLKNEADQVVGVLLSGEDVTESKSLKLQFIQSQKMEALGRLAGGVAHDFNNLLTVISGYAELMLSQFDGREDMRNDLEQIQTATRKASSLTNHLLAFSRRQMLEPEVFDLNNLIRDTEKILARLLGEDIDLVTFRDPLPARVKADPAQMEQVIMNLAVNARHAMPSGGQLTITTANVDLDGEFCYRQAAMRPGPYVSLTVADNGTGMDLETQSQIFEPFFTTKDRTKGTGLGLAMVYGTIKQSGGWIRVNSERRRGTSFEIYLPRIGQSQKGSPTQPVTGVHPTGTETILVVEDEDEVRALTKKMLESNGYKVLEASHAKEALQLCERYKGVIHLALTDVVMPQISGPELVRRLVILRPNMKVLFMSGYAEEIAARRGAFRKGARFLRKPFTKTHLAGKIREVLGAEDP